jgi:hypothetical protein
LKSEINYLRKPSLMPKSYEQALKEIKRRQIFRKGLDDLVEQLKSVISDEKSKR